MLSGDKIGDHDPDLVGQHGIRQPWHGVRRPPFGFRSRIGQPLNERMYAVRPPSPARRCPVRDLADEQFGLAYQLIRAHGRSPYSVSEEGYSVSEEGVEPSRSCEQPGLSQPCLPFHHSDIARRRALHGSVRSCPLGAANGR